MNNNNIEITNLHYTVVNCLNSCENPLCEAMEAIKGSRLKPTQKKMLMDKFKSIFAKSNDIINQLGKIGRVR